MGKKARKDRAINQRSRSRRRGRGKPKGKVTPMPKAKDTTQGEGGEVEQPPKPKIKKRLTDKQALAAQLMQARGVINRKNVALANLATNHAKETSDLRAEIAQLRAENFQAQINAEVRENELLAREHGLPEGDFSFKRDAKGWYVEFDAPEVGEDDDEGESDDALPAEDPEPSPAPEKTKGKKAGAVPPKPKPEPEPEPEPAAP